MTCCGSTCGCTSTSSPTASRSSTTTRSASRLDGSVADGFEVAGPAGGNNRSFQVHPTRRCNLRCLHCYSSSGPEHRDSLPVELLEAAVDDAAAAGYTVLSLSGGEPLMYSPLGRLLRHGRRHGMLTAVTTNGMLLDERHLADLADAVDLIAVSLDGVPDSHNRMRASDRAFDSMAGKLPKVRDSGIPFGFIFTLTQHNVAELEWVARFAVEQGAALLQIHPLEEVGRAFELLRGSHPDDMQSAYAFLEALRIQGAYEDRITVQLDLVDVEVLRDHPGRVFAHDGEPPQDARLAELVAPLIVEADATVVPLQYGFDRRYALGSLADHPLRELGERWVRTAYAGFRALCRQVFEEITAPDEDALPFVNWYEIVGLRAQAYGREARLEPGPA